MKLNKSFYKNTVFLYAIHTASKNRQAVLILDGLPANPTTKKDLISQLYRQGYDVFYPYYEGTFESKGMFLKKNPSKAIKTLIIQFKKGFNLNGKSYVLGKLNILASSFGGAVGLSLSNNSDINKLCILSPVLNYKTVKSIQTLSDFLAKNYTDIIRFKQNDWQRLLDNKIHFPFTRNYYYPNKILLFSGSKDDQLSISEIKKFSKKHKIKLKIKETGHVSLSKITPKMMTEIFSFWKADNN